MIPKYSIRVWTLLKYSISIESSRCCSFVLPDLSYANEFNASKYECKNEVPQFVFFSIQDSWDYYHSLWLYQSLSQVSQLTPPINPPRWYNSISWLTQKEHIHNSSFEHDSESHEFMDWGEQFVHAWHPSCDSGPFGIKENARRIRLRQSRFF